MWFILIVVAAVVVYTVLKSNRNEGTAAVSDNAVPAEVPGIMNFLHGFHSLCNNHNIVSSDVLISWKAVDGGSEIRAYTRIFKIDDLDAADAVDTLRMTISQAKHDIESSNKDANPAEVYQMKQKASDKMILDFFGTDSLEGSFWDIEDCEYIDGKYLEFEAVGMVYDSFNQSQNKTLDFVCSNVADKYPKSRLNRQGNNMITISFC